MINIKEENIVIKVKICANRTIIQLHSDIIEVEVEKNSEYIAKRKKLVFDYIKEYINWYSK